MLPSRDRPRTLSVYLLPCVLRKLLPDVRADCIREQRDRGHCAGVLVDQRCLAVGPRREELSGGRGADQAWVRHAREAHSGDVPRRGVDAVEVPDSLRSAALEFACWCSLGCC